LGFDIDDLTGIGPYSMYPRTSAIEANQVVNLVGGPYINKNYRARARVVFQNKNVMCQYRAVGHPIACSVTEGLVDLAAMKIGMDPVEIRRHNLIADDAYPCASPSGLRFEQLSHHASLTKIVEMMDYQALRTEQAALRQKGIHRGIGIASFIEVTNPSAAFYGVGGAKISSQDGVAVRLDAQGSVICQTSITEQGQGSESLTAQIVGSVLGVSMDRVRVILGDTDNTPYGGGTWASRGAGIGGEAALQATKVLRKNILDVAAAILQSTPGELDIGNNGVVNGLGAALFEKCVYDERGQLTNANMADYLVPMSGEMPDIDVGHVVSPTLESELGAKGAGEAGTAGAAAAVTNAVNDALRPFG